MEKCNFESGICSVECKKYPMCAYMSIQKQLSELQTQVNFAYNVLNNLLKKNEEVNVNLTNLDNKLMIFTEELLDLYNDSETNNKESINEEKN